MSRTVCSTIAIALPSIMSTCILFSLTVLYFTNGLKLSADKAYNLNTAFFSLFYCLPLFSGLISDKFLGAKKTLVLGLLFSILGFFMFSSGHWLFFSLTLMALGGAFFLPNIWKLLNSNVYNSARDRLNSFIVSYSALAVAGLIATSGAGYIADKYGYEFTFLIGGVLNLLSLCIFLLRSHIYKSEVNVAHNFKGGIIAIIFGFIVTYFLMNSPKLSQVIIIAIAIGLLFYFYTFYKMAISDKQRKSILQYFVCCMYSVVFWTVATLAQTSVTIFTQNNLDRYIFGFEFPSGSVIAFWYGSMILAIFVISVFIRNKDIIKNLVLGLITTTLACMTIFSAVYIRGIYNHVPFISIVIFYLFLGFGEVFVQPTGNAAAGEFMPENRRGIALGIWQFSGGLGVALSGYLANLTVNDNLSRLSDSNLIYSKIYMEIGVTCLALTLILYVVSRNLQAKI